MNKDIENLNIIKIGLIVEDIESGYKEGFLKYIQPIIDALNKKIKLQIFPIGNSTNFQSTNEGTYNVQKFNNAIEIIDILKPDLIIVTTSYEFISRSFLIGAKKKNIPSIMITSGILSFQQKQILTKTLPLRIYQILKFGKVYFRKYKFLIKTILKANFGFKYLLKTIIRDFNIPFKTLYNEFIENADLYLFSNSDWKKFAIKSGISEDKIKVVGEYAMDPIYEKVSILDSQTKTEQLKILFLTTGMVEHGYWKPNMRDKLVKEVTLAIHNQLKNTNLRIKIHPLAENIDDYKRIIFPIDSTIEIIQKGDLTLLINESDLIITYGQSSSLLEVLLLNKPILMINMFNESYTFIEEGVAMECKNTIEMINIIQNKKFLKIDNKIIKKFLERKLYKFDGKCGERAAIHILSMIK